MKNIYKDIAIVAAFLTLCTGYASYTYSDMKNKVPAANSNNIPNESKSSSIKPSSTYSLNSIVPFSSDIVIYSSHPDEDYKTGKKVTDVGGVINDKLAKEGLKSSFIKCIAPEEYVKSFQVTRKLITENVKGYNDTVLLDVSRAESDTKDAKTGTKNIILVLAENNPHYAENKKFADYLLTQFKSSNQVTSHILKFKNGILSFNQDLSNNGIFIEIGNNLSSDSDIEECVNLVVSALKNVQKS